MESEEKNDSDKVSSHIHHVPSRTVSDLSDITSIKSKRNKIGSAYDLYKVLAKKSKSSASLVYDMSIMGAEYTIEKMVNVMYKVIGADHEIINSEDVTDLHNGSISFSGGGYNCIYHMGIVKYIFEHNELFTNTTYLGASGGAGVAVFTLCYQDDPNRMKILKFVIDKIIEMESSAKSLSDQVDQYTNILLEFIDQDRFNLRVKGQNRLMISLTDVSSVVPKNKIINEFRDLQYLESVIRASACVPILLDNKIRKVDEVSYLDGGFTNNLPIRDENTIRISCIGYPGIRAEIKPSKFLDIKSCFMHPGETELHNVMAQGYIDMVEYLTEYTDHRSA